MEADTHMLKVPVVQPVTDKYEHLLIKKEKQYESPTPWEVSPLQEFAQQVGILRVPKISNNQFMGDVIGLVAQLGTVGTGDLSRVLAEYMGQDQMLAIVCRSFEAAGALEKFVQKPKKPMRGEVDSMHFLCEPALLQKPTHGQSFVFCLEDIRPYTGDFDRSDPQRKLALPDPVLPSGMAPDGFLGYAVNMVDLDSHHIHTVTSAGHGLRETVLYCLLGELQVYDTREDMLAAHDCIKHGSISLGGGILKQNGVTSFGVGDVEICFPVAKYLELLPSTNVVDVEKQIEEKSAQRRVRAKPSSKVGKWARLDDVQPPHSRVRVGSVFPPLSIACYDVNGNQIPFATTLEVAVKVQTNEGLLFRVEKFNKELSNHTLTIKDMLMESGELDKL